MVALYVRSTNYTKPSFAPGNSGVERRTNLAILRIVAKLGLNYDGRPYEETVFYLIVLAFSLHI